MDAVTQPTALYTVRVTTPMELVSNSSRPLTASKSPVFGSNTFVITAPVASKPDLIFLVESGRKPRSSGSAKIHGALGDLVRASEFNSCSGWRVEFNLPKLVKALKEPLKSSVFIKSVLDEQ